MTWKLWLDDQLDSVRPVPSGYIGAASSEEAIALVDQLGSPEFMDLDHDLGGEDNAMRFLRYLSNIVEVPPGYVVHSRNPCGKENIVSFMESWKKSLE